MRAEVYLYVVATFIVIAFIGSALYFTNIVDKFTNIKDKDSRAYVLFLSKQEAADFIDNDKDKYIENLSYIDLVARGVGSSSHYKDKAKGSVDSFSGHEQQRVRNAVKDANDRFAKIANMIDGLDIQKLMGVVWCFAKSDVGYEDGMPHTRLDVIFLPEHVLTKDTDPEYLINILLHEKIHVYQRMYPILAQKYIKANGFVLWKERYTEPLSRANPDLDPYIYTKGTDGPMMALYNSDKPKNLQDVTIQPVNKSSWEHPYEHMAYTTVQLINELY